MKPQTKATGPAIARLLQQGRFMAMVATHTNIRAHLLQENQKNIKLPYLCINSLPAGRQVLIHRQNFRGASAMFRQAQHAREAEMIPV